MWRNTTPTKVLAKDSLAALCWSVAATQAATEQLDR